MNTLHEALRNIHIIGGFIGLVLFWIPILSVKGSPLHRKTGVIWIWLSRVVIISAFSGLMMYVPELMAQGKTLTQHPNSYAFIVFLGYLSLIAFVVTIYAVKVLTHKKQPGLLSTRSMKSMAWSNIIASLLVFAFAIYFKPQMMLVLMAVSPIGLANGLGMLKYLSGKDASPHGWLYQHLDAMIAAGIAFHTAFLVFGATRLFDRNMITGWVGVLLWLSPTVIGVLASVIWQRKYKKRFNET